MLYHAPLSFEPSYTSLPKSSHTQAGAIEEAVKAASHGDAEAEQVAELLVQEDNQDRAYVIGEEEMKVFVNSERWSLGELTRALYAFSAERTS